MDEQFTRSLHELPIDMRSIIDKKPKLFSNRKYKYIYRLLQLWRKTENNQVADFYIDEIIIVSSLDWKDYKIYAKHRIKDIEKSFPVDIEVK